MISTYIYLACEPADIIRYLGCQLDHREEHLDIAEHKITIRDRMLNDKTNDSYSQLQSTLAELATLETQCRAQAVLAQRLEEELLHKKSQLDEV